MSRSGLAELVTAVIKSQGKEATEAMIELWESALKDLPVDLVNEAAVAATKTERFITPASLRSRALSIQRDRIERARGQVTAPSGLENQAYLKWEKAWKRAAVAGGSTEVASRAGLAAIGREVPGLPDRASRPAPKPALRTVGVEDTPMQEAVEGDILPPGGTPPYGGSSFNNPPF